MAKLEKDLEIPDDERQIPVIKLKKTKTVTIEGVRVSLPSEDDKAVGVISPFERAKSTTLLERRSQSVMSQGQFKKKGMKSIWKGKEDNQVSVEQLALEHYEGLGFKGYAYLAGKVRSGLNCWHRRFHAEGRIVSTIFTMLFWSVLFAPVPGAFETAYQTAPLDLAHDSFFSAREAAIEERLKEIEDGKARELIEKIDDEERGRATFAVGVRWDRFGKTDLAEIVEVRILDSPTLRMLTDFKIRSVWEVLSCR